MAALEQLQADASGEGYFEVPFLGEQVRVKAAEDWPASAVRATREGDFDTWAEKCLAEDDYKIWKRLDPTLGQLDEFFEALNEVTGMSPKESRNSPRSLNNSRSRSKRT